MINIDNIFVNTFKHVEAITAMNQLAPDWSQVNDEEHGNLRQFFFQHKETSKHVFNQFNGWCQVDHGVEYLVPVEEARKHIIRVRTVSQGKSIFRSIR